MKRLMTVSLLSVALVPLATANDLDPVFVGPVPGRYIVTLSDAAVGVVAGDPSAPSAVRSLAEDLARIYDGRVERTWGDALNGFVVEGLDKDMAKHLARNPFVLAVEPDNQWRSPPPLAIGCEEEGPFRTDRRTLPSSQSNGSQLIICGNPGGAYCVDNWGLDRINQRDGTRDGSYAWGENGYAVHIYIIDSGIDEHREFRDHLGLSRVDRTNAANFTNDLDTYDCTGHGTHVAGIAAGRTYGVAKDAILHPVKVGTLCTTPNSMDSWLISALDFVRQSVGQHQWPAVANLSGGNGLELNRTMAFQLCAANLIASGVQLVQSAGNEGLNACVSSLGDTTDALVVASSNSDDEQSATSNRGRCIDIFAPGDEINSARFTPVGNGDWLGAEFCSMSGTSMAAPHVSGALALYLDSSPGLTPSHLRNLLIGDSSIDVLCDDEMECEDPINETTPNRLLYVP